MELKKITDCLLFINSINMNTIDNGYIELWKVIGIHLKKKLLCTID